MEKLGIYTQLFQTMVSINYKIYNYKNCTYKI